MAKDPLPTQRSQRSLVPACTADSIPNSISIRPSGKPLKSSFESSGVVGSADVPDVGGVDDGRGSPNR